MDYAETEKMKSLLMLSVNNESSTVTQCAEVSIKTLFHCISCTWV